MTLPESIQDLTLVCFLRSFYPFTEGFYPSKLKKLTITFMFGIENTLEIVNELPITLVYVPLDFIEIGSIPPTVYKMTIIPMVKSPLVKGTLPPNLQELDMFVSPYVPFPAIPEKVSSLKIRSHETLPLEIPIGSIPESVISLEFSECILMEPINKLSLPSKLQTLILDDKMFVQQCFADFPASLRELTITITKR
eukprot:gene5503-6857_t